MVASSLLLMYLPWCTTCDGCGEHGLLVRVSSPLIDHDRFFQRRLEQGVTLERHIVSRKSSVLPTCTLVGARGCREAALWNCESEMFMFD
jgi:hypothetical protein